MSRHLFVQSSPKAFNPPYPPYFPPTVIYLPGDPFNVRLTLVSTVTAIVINVWGKKNDMHKQCWDEIIKINLDKDKI